MCLEDWLLITSILFFSPKVFKGLTVFLLMDALGPMQNIDREALSCTQFAKPNVFSYFVFLNVLEIDKTKF